jgi:hypothetical protein
MGKELSKLERAGIKIGVLVGLASLFLSGINTYVLITRPPFPQNSPPELLIQSSTRVIPQGGLDHYYISDKIPINNDKSIALFFTFDPHNATFDVRQTAFGYYQIDIGNPTFTNSTDWVFGSSGYQAELKTDLNSATWLIVGLNVRCDIYSCPSNFQPTVQIGLSEFKRGV